MHRNIDCTTECTLDSHIPNFLWADEVEEGDEEGEEGEEVEELVEKEDYKL